MNYKGVTIDTNAIARGLIDMMDDLDEADSYNAAIRFGMLPAPLMQCLETTLTNKAREIIEARIGTRPDGSNTTALEMWKYMWEATADWRKQFVKQVQHEVALAMYRQTPMVV